MYPWNKEGLNLSRLGNSETFWSRGWFPIPYSKSLVVYAMTTKLTIVLGLFKSLQVIQKNKMTSKNYWSQQFLKHHYFHALNQQGVALTLIWGWMDLANIVAFTKTKYFSLFSTITNFVRSFCISNFSIKTYR